MSFTDAQANGFEVRAHPLEKLAAWLFFFVVLAGCAWAVRTDMIFKESRGWMDAAIKVRSYPNPPYLGNPLPIENGGTGITTSDSIPFHSASVSSTIILASPCSSGSALGYTTTSGYGTGWTCTPGSATFTTSTTVDTGSGGGTKR